MVCDVECSRDAQCGALGAHFACKSGRCRTQSGTGAVAGRGGTAGNGSSAGRGGAGSNAGTSGSTAGGGGGAVAGSGGSGDVCGDFERTFWAFTAAHQACSVDADCAIGGQCSVGIGFYAVAASALAESWALSAMAPSECVYGFDGPIYRAACDQKRCTEVETGDGCGSMGSPPQGAAICDGSSAIRLALTVTAGGQVQSTFYFTNPHGFSYALVDGQCHFYAAGSAMKGVHTGTLSTAQAEQLARDIHWQGFQDIAGPNQGGCPDASTVSILVPGASTACTCGCPMSSPRSSAITQASMWMEMLAGMGTAIDGPVHALAMPTTAASVMGSPSPWPLTHAMRYIPGLIVSESTVSTADSGAVFTEMTDVASLRALRASALSAYAYASWIPIQNVGDTEVFALYVRDDLPTEVETAFSAFVAR
jgi:hypothetical protein